MLVLVVHGKSWLWAQLPDGCWFFGSSGGRKSEVRGAKGPFFGSFLHLYLLSIYLFVCLSVYVVCSEYGGVCGYVQASTHTYMYLHICMYPYVQVYVYVYGSVCVYVHVHAYSEYTAILE